MSGGGFRVSIPNSLRKTIQNLKEITGNHSDEEIYAMLKECSMDPNETAQKLLLQDPFHEVKSKRDKRKENLNNRESAESQWRPGTQGRGSKGGRGNFSARYASHDLGGGKNFHPGKQNGTNQVIKKGGSSSVSSQETKNKEMSSSGPAITNGPDAVSSGNTSVMHITSGSGKVQHEVLPSSVDINTLGSAPSSSDHVVLPSSDPQLPIVAGTIKREVGTHQPPGEQNALPTLNQSIIASEASTPSVPGKIPNKSQGGGKNQLSESYQPSSATHGGSSLSRPSANYNNRSQQIIGPQKVSSNKEWKPKPTTSVVAQGPGVTATSEVPIAAVEASSQPQHDSSVLDSEEASSKLQRKLEEPYLPPRQHVILPNHIHVPESERNKFTFGSFGANFELTTSVISGSASDKSSTPVSEKSHVVEDTVEEQASSNQNTLETNEEGEFPDQAQSDTPAPENLSPGDGDVSASAVPEYNETKQDTASLPGGHQSSVVHTSPHYNFGFVAPMMGSQVAPYENSESQARDVPRLPGFVVQQPYDPASYYAQFYRSGTESDGRLSPFPSPGIATKYNGNVAVLPPQTSQSPQEGANSVVLTTAGPSPLVTQSAGLMQSSLPVTQQPIPVFRPSPGMHISHYPPNYLPYGHYFSPFYVPPPMHHYFPQQPQPGNVYSAPPSASASGVKYPLMQYKPGGNTGNSITNEDLGGSQFKDNNVYMTAQQVSSFYNVPPPGQHVAFAPTQPGHGTFATVHPLLQQSQAMPGAADMVGPAASAYQQPQHSQVNWPGNY